MLSSKHEEVLVLIRNRPALAPELVATVLGEPLPAFTEARLAASDLTEERPAAWHVDAVIELAGTDGTTAGAIVVEVQRAVDQRKKYTIDKLGEPHRTEADALYWYTSPSECYYYKMGMKEGYGTTGTGNADDCKKWAVQ